MHHHGTISRAGRYSGSYLSSGFSCNLPFHFNKDLLWVYHGWGSGFALTWLLHVYHPLGDSLVAQMVKDLPAMQETLVWSLGWEDPLEKKMATHSSILAWIIPWTEEPGGLQSMRSKRVKHDWATNSLTYPLEFFSKHSLSIVLFFLSSIEKYRSTYKSHSGTREIPLGLQRSNVA